jgi:hypothetical protein
MVSIICVRTWLSYRSYKFITKEIDAHSVMNSYDEVFYTKNSDLKKPTSTLTWLLLKIIALISRN